jgi:hypothetical protein
MRVGQAMGNKFNEYHKGIAQIYVVIDEIGLKVEIQIFSTNILYYFL